MNADVDFNFDAPREVPMLYTGDMIRALLRGGKTQTRRPLKTKTKLPTNFRYDGTGFDEHDFNEHYIEELDGEPLENYISIGKSPLGKVGDVHWARETWAPHDDQAMREKDISHIYYRADDETKYESDGRWRPSIHMPRWAARIFSRVTEINVERIRDISEADARAEGFRDVGRFADAWRAIYGVDAWARNDFVWVSKFELLKNYSRGGAVTRSADECDA